MKQRGPFYFLLTTLAAVAHLEQRTHTSLFPYHQKSKIRAVL